VGKVLPKEEKVIVLFIGRPKGNIKRNFIAVFICTVLLFWGPLFARQEEEKKDKAVTLPDVEVVVTGAKQAQTVGSVTQKIDVVNREELDKNISANRNVAEALKHEPGASVSVLSRNDANWGTYGGIGPKYCTYMLQGLPVDAFIDPMSLDLEAVQRIEVLRGPASVLYPNYLSQDFAGGQSPLAGTVNLILKDRIQRRQTRVSTAYGSYNTLNGQFYHQGNIHHIHFFAGAGYEMSDYADYGSENSWLNMQDDPEYRKSKLFAGVTFLMGEKENQRLSLFVNKAFHRGDAGRVYRGFDHNYLTVNAGYFADLSRRINLNMSLGLRQYDRQWQDSYFEEVDHLLSNNGVYQNILPADIALTIRHGDDHLLTMGADYQGADYYTWSDPLLGYRLYGNKSFAWQAGFYAQEELRFGSFVVRGGLRYAYIQNKIDFINGAAPGEKDAGWNKLLWSAGFRYSFSSAVAMFANAGSSFITPGLKSVGGTIGLLDRGVAGRHGQLPNPELKPEAGLGMDVGFDVFLTDRLFVGARGFFITVNDAIVENVVSQNPSQTQSVNAGKSQSLGGEIEIKHRLNEVVRWFANCTFIDTRIENSFDPDQDGADVPFAPSTIVNVGLDITTSFGLSVSPTLNYNTGYYDSSSLSNRRKFTTGVILNLYLSQVLAIGNSHQLEWFAQLINLTDNRFDMPWQFRNLGFSVMSGIRATF
jgi:outer membrane receptor for ferrienterochelin and colicin